MKELVFLEYSYHFGRQTLSFWLLIDLKLPEMSDGMKKDKRKCASCSLHLKDHLLIISSAESTESQQIAAQCLGPHKPLVAKRFSL